MSRKKSKKKNGSLLLLHIVGWSVYSLRNLNGVVLILIKLYLADVCVKKPAASINSKGYFAAIIRENGLTAPAHPIERC
jgi:hypothetical protein